MQLNGDGRGAFLIREGEGRLGEMAISIAGSNLTFIILKRRGRQKEGFAEKLLTVLVEHAQLKRNPGTYADVWKKDGSEKKST